MGNGTPDASPMCRFTFAVGDPPSLFPRPTPLNEVQDRDAISSPWVDEADVVILAEAGAFFRDRPVFANPDGRDDLEDLNFGRAWSVLYEVNDQSTVKWHGASFRFVLGQPVAVSSRLAQHQVIRLLGKREAAIRLEIATRIDVRRQPVGRETRRWLLADRQDSKHLWTRCVGRLESREDCGAKIAHGALVRARHKRLLRGTIASDRGFTAGGEGERCRENGQLARHGNA